MRPAEEIDAEQREVKGFKAKGKRISTWEIDSITELEPIRFQRRGKIQQLKLTQK